MWSLGDGDMLSNVADQFDEGTGDALSLGVRARPAPVSALID
jgi:hypothetical protein